jgi:hypothetical protein
MSANNEILENQVAKFQSSGDLIRLNAQVILQWPWENGIPLDHGSMTESLSKGTDVTLHPEVRDLIMVSQIPSGI